METLLGTLSDIQSIITFIGIVVGGGWAFWKFIVHKEAHPRIEFSVDINFVGKQGDEWLIEILGLLENKGKVPHKMSNLQFDVKYLKGSDPLDENAKFGDQIDIKNMLKASSWLPSADDVFARLYPGVSMRYNYIYKVPADATYLLVHGLLDYGNKGEQTRADRLVKVPNDN